VSELCLFRRAALVVHADAMERSLAEHRAILTALASRDADHAAALMHAHANGGLQRAEAACKEGADESGKESGKEGGKECGKEGRNEGRN
jgi:DNA-binding GntR family transcriptional regulator